MVMFWFTPFILVPVHFVGRKFGQVWGITLAAFYGVGSTIVVLWLCLVKDWGLNGSYGG